jgi:hypothetical protein
MTVSDRCGRGFPSGGGHFNDSFRNIRNLLNSAVNIEEDTEQIFWIFPSYHASVVFLSKSVNKIEISSDCEFEYFEIFRI